MRAGGGRPPRASDMKKDVRILLVGERRLLSDLLVFPWRFPCHCQAGAGISRLTNWDCVNRLSGKLGEVCRTIRLVGKAQSLHCGLNLSPNRVSGAHEHSAKGAAGTRGAILKIIGFVCAALAGAATPPVPHLLLL
ncbi:hypothetical protein H8959_019920 [Pygathrix nigripes]